MVNKHVSELNIENSVFDQLTKEDLEPGTLVKLHEIGGPFFFFNLSCLSLTMMFIISLLFRKIILKLECNGLGDQNGLFATVTSFNID